MRDETIGDFLSRLADRVPAPGGGASAALHAAQGAALLGMVARYSTGEKYEKHAEIITQVLIDTDELREVSLQVAKNDELAFTAVSDAYKLPKSTDEEKASRSTAIAQALVGAAKPPAQVIEIADNLITLAEKLLPVGNRNVITDVAAGAEAARAAATTGRVNVEINLGGIKDTGARDELSAVVTKVDEIAQRADQVTAAVRKEITQ